MGSNYDPDRDGPRPGLQPKAIQRQVGEAVIELLTTGRVGKMKPRYLEAAIESGDLAQIIGEVAIQAIGNPALERLIPGEPIFVLRGNDRCALPAIAAWIHIAALNGCPEEKLSSAVDRQVEMMNWPGKKFPD